MPTHRRDEAGAPECAECSYRRTLPREAPPGFCACCLSLPAEPGKLCSYCAGGLRLAYAELKEKQPMNEPNNHTILGDLAAVVEQHGGSWRVESEPLGHAYLNKLKGNDADRPKQLWHVSWLPPARANGEIRRPVSCTRPSIEAAAAAVLACIEHFTRPDGGLDL
jgi:hypothetical protein